MKKYLLLLLAVFGLAALSPTGVCRASVGLSLLAECRLKDSGAVGVVGAIATNLGATSTDRKLNLARWERALMFCTFLVMAAIEISVLIDKPGARLFAGSVVAVGLVLRGITAGQIFGEVVAEIQGSCISGPFTDDICLLGVELRRIGLADSSQKVA